MLIETIVLIILLCFWITAISLAPFVPTFGKDLERINKICDLKAGDNFVEIWCGTAKVSRFIALKNPNANIIWVELNFFLYLYSKLKTSIFWPKNLHIKFWNALKYDYHNTQVVYIFWVPKTVSWKIKDKVYKELPKNWKYISYVFKVENWEGKEVMRDFSEKQNSIYVCVK